MKSIAICGLKSEKYIPQKLLLQTIYSLRLANKITFSCKYCRTLLRKSFREVKEKLIKLKACLKNVKAFLSDKMLGSDKVTLVEKEIKIKTIWVLDVLRITNDG